MPRNRMIKAEFWESETLARLSLESNLTFIGLWNFCDDYGVMLFNTRRIVGDLFPYRENINENDVEKWIFELIEAGLIDIYDAGGKKYLKIRNWEEHQKVVNKSKRRCPELLEENRLSLDTIETLNSVYIDPMFYNKKEKEKQKENHKYKQIVLPTIANAIIDAPPPGKEAKFAQKNKSDLNHLATRKQLNKNYDREINLIITNLNLFTGRRFNLSSNATQKELKARLKENYSVDDFNLVVKHKCNEWLNDEKMSKHLNPTTLFRKSNFERYLDEARELQDESGDIYKNEIFTSEARQAINEAKERINKKPLPTWAQVND